MASLIPVRRVFFCKETILKCIEHQKYKATTRISGRYKTNISNTKAKFKVQLPEFCKSRTATVDTTVEKADNDRHNMVFGIPFFQALNLKLDFETEMVTWDGITINMNKSHRKIHQNNAINSSDADGADKQLPEKTWISTERVNSGITSSSYDKHD